ncbi:YbaB/EbfC family nucleoid-associated protein, partial [Francisella tularensis subsp. holarctica]
KEILEDLIAAAVNIAVKKVEENSTASSNIYKMAKDAGIDLPSGINFPFK